jgi:broad specificity phosphatase PhoE
MEMSFGRWEGFTFAELQVREAVALAQRERDKWGFVLPGGESYAQLQVRVRGWYESVEHDTVVAAHGGVCRALIAHLGVAPPEAASMGDIRQGAVYVFDGGTMSRHECCSRKLKAAGLSSSRLSETLGVPRSTKSSRSCHDRSRQGLISPSTPS